MNDGPDDYCRQVEAYLCRKNDGHLIRIVGPAFEQVCAWASKGIPLKAVFRGIDRYVERYYARDLGDARSGSSSAKRTSWMHSTNGAVR